MRPNRHWDRPDWIYEANFITLYYIGRGNNNILNSDNRILNVRRADSHILR